MPNEIYRDHAKSLIKVAVDKSEDAARAEHKGVRGAIREHATAGIFSPFLTSDYRTGTGIIIDSEDRQSPQTDLIIWSPSLLPPVLYAPSNAEGFYPIESCLYSIEVKSILTASQLKNSVDKARKLRKLQLVGPGNQQMDSRVLFSLFAFGSDLTLGGKSELDRYKEIDPEWNLNPLIPAFCIAGLGYWVFVNPRGGWVKYDPTADHDEVLGFIIGLTNSLPMILAARQGPRLAPYLNYNPPISWVPNSHWSPPPPSGGKSTDDGVR